ncbi:hypothetical protein C0971_16810 [Bacillus methanolicus]|nr:hypothetical protein C0971_16810 [Bacillus methanolicus]
MQSIQALVCNTASWVCEIPYKGKHVLLVLDNARFHHAKQMKELLFEYEDEFMFIFYQHIPHN